MDIRKTRRSFLTGLGGLAIGSAATPLLHAGRIEKPTGIEHSLKVSGSVYSRGHPDYERSRQNTVWQALKPERYPDIIVNAHTEDDIVETIHYARAQSLPVAVRGSGHNYVAGSVSV